MERKTQYRGRLLKMELLGQRLSAINLWLKVVLGWASTVGKPEAFAVSGELVTSCCFH
jgi:hypothetical protein